MWNVVKVDCHVYPISFLKGRIIFGKKLLSHMGCLDMDYVTIMQSGSYLGFQFSNQPDIFSLKLYTTKYGSKILQNREIFSSFVPEGLLESPYTVGVPALFDSSISNFLYFDTFRD